MRFQRPRWWLAGAALLVFGLLWVRYDHRLHHRLLHMGDSLTPLAVQAIDGSWATVKPAGRPQVINVFATWCLPCRAEMPAFAAAARTLQRRGVLVIGIDQEEGPAQVARFAHDFALPYPVYIDRDRLTHDVLGARMIPFTIYVDARGFIRWKHAGPLSTQDLRDLAARVRSEG